MQTSGLLQWFSVVCFSGLLSAFLLLDEVIRPDLSLSELHPVFPSWRLVTRGTLVVGERMLHTEPEAEGELLLA
jgi:hypothetical protein